MNLILLSGESINNKIWIEEVERTLCDLFDETKILYYDHWESGEDSINLEKEFSKLPQLVDGLGDYFIFAKSIGSVLSLKGIKEKILKPKKCFFAGPAFLIVEENIPDFKNWIENFSLPSIIISKTSDPVAPAAKIKALLEKYNVKNYQFIEIPGDNHKYDDLKQTRDLLDNFIN